jgi:hypothetical protein
MEISMEAPLKTKDGTDIWSCYNTPESVSEGIKISTDYSYLHTHIHYGGIHTRQIMELA